jgi:hypothetical protein
LPERRHLLRLEELRREVSRFVVELLAPADVAHECFDAQRAAGSKGMGARRNLDPDGGMVGAPKSQQVVDNAAVGGQAFEHRLARLLVDEAIRLKWPDVGFGGVRRVAEDPFQVGVGRDCGGPGRVEGADVDALLHSLDEASECVRSSFHDGFYFGGGG